MERGRPTKYTETTIEEAFEYIDNHEKYGDVVPIRAGLARHLGVAVSTLNNWGSEYPDFLSTLEILQSEQERQLVNGGLQNEMNSTITKLMLANHNYGDKQQVEHVGGVTLLVSDNLARATD